MKIFKYTYFMRKSKNILIANEVSNIVRITAMNLKYLRKRMLFICLSDHLNLN